MKIQISKDDETGHLEVWQHGKTTGRLCVGEMIEHVLGMLMADKCRTYEMKTPEEWGEKRTFKPTPVEILTFADQHGLSLRINPRTNFSDFAVSFAWAEVKKDIFLVGEFGCGRTIDDALIAYASLISGKVLVVNATDHDKRREILVPQLTHTEAVP